VDQTAIPSHRKEVNNVVVVNRRAEADNNAAAVSHKAKVEGVNHKVVAVNNSTHNNPNSRILFNNHFSNHSNNNVSRLDTNAKDKVNKALCTEYSHANSNLRNLYKRVSTAARVSAVMTVTSTVA
jgi:hypothetical protein